jgi:hypothetical protein
VEALVNPVVHLDEDRGWDDERLLGSFDELATSSMVSVATIERRVEWTGIENQRHARGRLRSTPVRHAVSLLPEAPTPRLRGRGLW